MRRLASSFLAATASAFLLIACDGARVVDPATRDVRAAKVPSLLAAPSSASVTALSTSQIDIRWQDNSTNESNFQLDRSTTGPTGTFASLILVGANAVVHSDQGLAAGTQYCYRVRALRSAGNRMTYSAFSNTACGTTTALPPPPPNAPAAASGTNAAPTSSGSVLVKWIDNSTNEAGFRIYRSIDAGALWSLVGSVVTNYGAVEDFGLQSEQQVCYQVVAFNAGGDAPASVMTCTTPPASPSAVTARQVDALHFELSWSDNSSVEDAYEVWLKYENGCGGDPFEADCSMVEELVAVLPANATSYRAPLDAWWGYSYFIVALKDGGWSDGVEAVYISNN